MCLGYIQVVTDVALHKLEPRILDRTRILVVRIAQINVSASSVIFIGQGVFDKNKRADLIRALKFSFGNINVPGAYFSAALVMSCVKAPLGSLVITGSEPPPSNVLTVR